MGQEIDLLKDEALAQLKASIGLPTLRRVTAQLVATAAGDYAALDVISQSATNNVGTAVRINNMLAPGQTCVTVYKVFSRSDDNSLLARTRLHFFDRALVAADAELDDNAVFTITTFNAVRANLGYIDLPAYAARSAGVVSQANQLREEFRVRGQQDSGNDDGSLWMVVQLLDAETNEATGMQFEWDFYVA